MVENKTINENDNKENISTANIFQSSNSKIDEASTKKQKSKKRKNIEIMIAVALGIIAIVIYFSTLGFGANANTKSGGVDDYSQKISNELQSILSSISGAGKVKVLVTFSDDGETIFAKNIEKKNEITTEGGTQTENITEKETLILVGGKPVVEKEIKPKVLGVVVVSSGGGNAKVKLEIIKAVQTLLKVDASIIEVFSMS